MTLDPRERLIVALDVATVGGAQDLVKRMGASVSFYGIL
jgi:orotidine-5'-phosphate decarboxylase